MKNVKIHQLKEHMASPRSGRCTQMMSYVIETGNGSLAVIDGGMTGDAEYLLEYLKGLGGRRPRISAWFITHAHYDHYGALDALLAQKADLEIERLVFHFPSEGFLRKYAPDVLEDGVLDFVSRIHSGHIPVYPAEAGDEIYLDDALFKIIYVPGERFLQNQTNNSSIVIRLEACGQSVLFTGDIGVEAGEDMMEVLDKKLLQADIVQMSHHGQRGATQKFYQAVSPKACLWPTPDWLWNNDGGGGFNTHIYETLETRRWMRELGVRHHVVSMNGTAVIVLPVDFEGEWGMVDL